MKREKNIAVILAGGTGRRLGASVPKQFLTVRGKTVLEYTVDTFERHELIDEIAIVVHPSYLADVELLVVKNGWQKVQHILKGGDERYMSSLAAIQAYADHGDWNLVIHDAARPLVSERIITNVIDALDQYNAVGVVVPMTDTVFEIDGDYISSIPNRSSLRRAQTPQAFHCCLIAKAYSLALADPEFASTDDCGVVLRYLPETRIHVIDGEERNMKLTYSEDIQIFEHYLETTGK